MCRTDSAACSDGVQPGNHDPGRSLVQNATDPDAFAGFDPDDRRDAVASGGNDAVPDRIFTAGAVFKIDQHPVGACRCTDLGRSGR